MKHILIPSIFSLTLLAGCSTPSDQQIDKRYETLAPAEQFNVGFLIMDGTYNTEFTAPWDIFHHTIFREGVQPMHPFSIAKSSAPIRTFEGISIKPDFSYTEDSLPRIDILVVPSAEHHLDTDLEDTTLISLVRRLGHQATFVVSLCDGAFVLAKAGLLNDVASTTFPSDISRYKEQFPHLEVIDTAHLVHNGKFITSAGGARSFDAALYLCEHLYGKEVADQLAAGLVIDWELENLKAAVIK